MTQRMIAVCIAAPLLLVLAVVALAVPLPYAYESPGPTYNILGTDQNDSELVQVDGHRVYRDDGQLRFTTVRTSPYGEKLTLGEALSKWLNPDDAVIPYDIAHPPTVTAQEEESQGAVDMVTSQDNAIAVALEEMGTQVPKRIQVAAVTDGLPAASKLQVHDIFVSADGKKVTSAQDVVDAVTSHQAGDPVHLVVLRDGRRLTVDVAPKEVDGEPRIGVTVGIGYVFPFDISINVDPTIGGPSAGLMFSLAVYDTLTPGSLTGGHAIAGTGEIEPDGSVGPIGGIQQKIAAADDAGVELFFVPPDNCEDVKGLDPDLKLVKADTMHDARIALQDFASGHDDDLPHC
ncbi:YlbL family protein [Nocardioides panacisoli]|uniref:endopeptidase La n=1 Tax=Nocardioides panacisoli TaxID=627624 RepID=A0ABP7J516_9ACTN